MLSSCFSRLNIGASLNRCTLPLHQLKPALFPSLIQTRSKMTMNQIIRKGLPDKKRKIKSPALDGCPQKKAVCLKLFAVKPKKPNSAQRKCARVRLSNNRVVIAHIPGLHIMKFLIVKVKGTTFKSILSSWLEEESSRIAPVCDTRSSEAR
jgi:ribosomal protein S12